MTEEKKISDKPLKKMSWFPSKKMMRLSFLSSIMLGCFGAWLIKYLYLDSKMFGYGFAFFMGVYLGFCLFFLILMVICSFAEGLDDLKKILGQHGLEQDKLIDK